MDLLLKYIPRLSIWMFLVLFPGQFLYSSAVKLEVIPSVLGSGIGASTGLVFILLFPFVIYSSYKLKQTVLIYFLFFIALFLHVSAYLVFHYFFGSDIHQRPDVVQQWLVLIISWCAIFSIGYFWPKKLSRVEVFILGILLLIMSTFVFFNLQAGKLIYVLGQYNYQEYFLGYQGYARLISITGLVLLALIRQKYIFWFVSIVFLSAVFLVGGRSELICVLFVAPILIFYQWLSHSTGTLIITFFVIVVFSVLAAMYWSELSASRHIKLFALSESISFQQRKALNKEALEAIVEKPILGDFSGHARSRKSVGHYAHNILSSWRQLGLFGFILYSVLIFWPAIATYLAFIKNPGLMQVDIWRILGVISIFTLLLAVGAKSVFSSVFALSWGMFVAALKYMEPKYKTSN